MLEDEPPRADAPPMPPERLAYPLWEVAALLAVSLSTVERLVARGELPSIRVATRVRVTRAALAAYVAGQAAAAPPAS